MRLSKPRQLHFQQIDLFPYVFSTAVLHLSTPMAAWILYFLLLTCIGCIGVLTALLSQAWLVASLFIIVILISCWQLSKPISKPLSAEQPVDNPFSDPGIFTYFPEGFSVASTTGRSQVAWQDIHAMFGYKIDLYTIDQIQLDIFCQQSVLTLTEELPGWHPFLRRLNEQFPTIGLHWEVEISTPAFATNLTLLYEKTGLSSEAAQLLYYSPNRKSDIS